MSPLLRHILPASLIVVGVIHLLPLSGALGTSRLAALYGLTIDDPGLTILMRHRSVLFGLLGAFLIYAAFRPQLQFLALIAGAVSVGAFLWLAWRIPGYNEQLARVVAADVVAAIVLATGFITWWLTRTSR